MTTNKKMRNAWYHLNTKNRTLSTTDKTMVQNCINTGLVPFLVNHKDGYLRLVHRKLTTIERTCSNGIPETFYQVKK